MIDMVPLRASKSRKFCSLLPMIPGWPRQRPFTCCSRFEQHASRRSSTPNHPDQIKFTCFLIRDEGGEVHDRHSPPLTQLLALAKHTSAEIHFQPQLTAKSSSTSHALSPDPWHDLSGSSGHAEYRCHVPSNPGNQLLLTHSLGSVLITPQHCVQASA